MLWCCQDFYLDAGTVSVHVKMGGARFLREYLLIDTISCFHRSPVRRLCVIYVIRLICYLLLVDFRLLRLRCYLLIMEFRLYRSKVHALAYGLYLVLTWKRQQCCISIEACQDRYVI